MVDKNIKNFLKSKDFIRETYGIGTKIRYVVFLAILTVVDILFYSFDVHFLEKETTLIDLIMACVFLAIGLCNLLVGALLNNYKYFYLHYGIIALDISCYCYYWAFRTALCFLPAWCLCFPFLLWGVQSTLYIGQIKTEIRQNKWGTGLGENNEESVSVARVRKHRKINIFVWAQIILLVAVAVSEMVLGLKLANVTLADATFRVHFSRIVISYCILSIGGLMIFGWKLILKQKYAMRYWIELSSNATDGICEKN